MILVANLKPAKLCGEESMGMICAADMPDGGIKVVFLDDDVPAGTKNKIILYKKRLHEADAGVIIFTQKEKTRVVRTRDK